MSFNKILASMALILAILAAFIGTPYRNEININEIASLIENEKDHITPVELAEQIFAGKKIRLIDLRDSNLFIQQHISHSENMSLQQLLNGEIKRNENVVLYSEGGIHASQAWMLLKMNHFDSIYTLLGGFIGWKEEILYPTLKTDDPSEKKDNFERRKILSLYFGGEPTIILKETVKKKTAQQKQQLLKQVPPIQFQKEEEKLRDQC
jgi:rhodanese-related sulfurtransferase